MVAAAGRLAHPLVRHEALNFGDALREVRVRPRGSTGIVGQEGERLHDPVDRQVAIERVAAPRGVIITMLGQVLDRCSERCAGAAFESLVPSAAVQHAPDALGRILQHRFEPGVKGSVEQHASILLGRHLEQWVDARLDGPLANQVGAEGVNSAQPGGLHVAQRGVQTPPDLVAGDGFGPGPLDLRPQAELQFACGLFGEGQGHHPIERAFPGDQRRYHA